MPPLPVSRRPRRPPELVSVVIPARNARRLLGDQLCALAAQTYAGAWEVVIVDDGSTDGTGQLARRWAAAVPRARVLAVPTRRGSAGARNVGARAARGELLAFCDADDVVCAGWLAALVAAAGRAHLVTGPHEFERLNDPLVRSWHWPLPTDRLRVLHDFLPGAGAGNMAVWADAFRGLGGFEEDAGCGYDVALWWQAQLAGLTVAFAPGAVLHERHRPTLGALARQYFRYGRGDAWLYRRFRGAGMPATPFEQVRATWRRTLTGAWAAARSPRRHGAWVQTAALSAGRLAGSVRHRSCFL